MADDLNDFLKQAALRREARKKASGQQSTQGRAIPQNSGSQPTQRAKSSTPEPDVLQPISVEDRHLATTIAPLGHLGGGVAKTDQKRDAHLRETFSHTPVPLERQQKKKAKQQKTYVATIAAPTNTDSVTQDPISNPDGRAEAPGNYKVMSPQDLLKLLRNPDSLKMAFIASEIFGRKFQ